tara:strand:- start:3059 stop:3475 length:417 start_codon:yes stop_codon:yes gene_type:complete
MLKLISIFFFISVPFLVEAKRFIEPLEIRLSFSGLHTKVKKRHIVFKKNKKVFEKKERNETELLWGFFSVFYDELKDSNLMKVDNRKYKKVEATCERIVSFEVEYINNSRKFEICESPRQKGDLPAKIIKWSKYLLYN